MLKEFRTVGRLGLFAVLVALACGLVACGDDDGGGGSSGSDTEAAATSSEASGEPIKVFSQGPYTSGATAAFDQIRSAANAAVESINAAGGVSGRPLELETCDSKLTPNGEQACYQKAVTDTSVVAAVGGYNIFPEAFGKLVEQGGLPIVGGMGNGTVALTSKNFFAQVAGYPNSYYVAGQHAVETAGKQIAFYGVDLPGTALLTDATSDAVKAGGGQMLDPVLISAAETSTAASSSKVAALKPDAVILAISPLQTISGIGEMRRDGFDGPIYVQTTLSSAQSLEALAKFDNLVGFQMTPPWTDTSVPGIKAFRDDMAKYEPKAPLDEVAVQTWLSFHVLKQVAEKMDGDLTRESLMAELEKTSELDTQGLTTDVEGWYTATPPDPEYPRAFNNHATITTLEKGEMGWDKTWYPGLGGGEKIPAG